MKVLLINSICGHGSTGRIVSDLWKELKSQGHEVKVAFGLGQGINVSDEDCISYNNKAGYYIHNLLAKLTDKTGLFSTKQTKKLVQEIVRYDPDVIHIHQLHGYHINYKVLFEYLINAEKKVVWTLHDCWAITGHCTHFSFNNCDKWKTGCTNCKFLKEYPKTYFNGNVENNYNLKKQLFTKVKDLTIITPSQWLATVVKESFLGIYPIKVVSNGIDMNIFKPQKTDFKKRYQIEGKKMILAVANVWDEKKGFSDFIKLSEILDDNYKLVMVGVTEEQKKLIPKSILALIRTSDINELIEIYSAADVFVNLSVEETFGMVTVEAMACGTPVITYDKTAVPEVVYSGTGIVIESGNINRVAEEIINSNFINYGNDLSKYNIITTYRQIEEIYHTSFK